MNVLLFIHIVISLTLIAVILLQKSSSDGLSGLASTSGNMGIVSGRAAANFLTKTTMILATMFIVNALILANLSSKKRHHNTVKQLDQSASAAQASEHLPVK